jgi:hypothetical protein
MKKHTKNRERKRRPTGKLDVVMGEKIKQQIKYLHSI